MEIPDTVNGWISIGATVLFGGAGYWAVKVFGPILKSGWDATTANNRAEKNMLDEMQERNNDLQKRLDDAMERERQTLEALGSVKLLEFKLEQATMELAKVTKQLIEATAEIAHLRDEVKQYRAGQISKEVIGS